MGRQTRSLWRKYRFTNFPGEDRKLCGVLRVGRFRQLFHCALVWLGPPNIVGRWQTVDSESNRRSAQSTVRQREPSGTFPCRTAKPEANERRILTKLYHDVCRLMSLAYPGESSALSDIVGRDAFMKALDDQALRVRIPEKEPNKFGRRFQYG